MKTKKEITKEYFDRTASGYDESHDGKFVRCMYDELTQRVLDLKGDRILDLGCGNGNILGRLIQEREAEYDGLDLSEQMIEEAGIRLGKKVRLTVGDAEHLPYGPQSFDILLCSASFHHYPHPVQAVREMHRVLKPGGTVVLGEPTLPSGPVLWLFNRLIRYSNSGDVRLWSRKDIVPLFEQNGFAVENFKRLNYRTFVMNARKRDVR